MVQEQAPARSPKISRWTELTSEELRAWVDRFGIHQGRTARRVGITYTAFRNWVSGRAAPLRAHQRRLRALIDAFPARGFPEEESLRALIGPQRVPWLLLTASEFDRWRIGQGLSVAALAEQLGVNDRIVRRWMTGRGSAPPPDLQRTLRARIDAAGPDDLVLPVRSPDQEGNWVVRHDAFIAWWEQQELPQRALAVHLDVNEGSVTRWLQGTAPRLAAQRRLHELMLGRDGIAGDWRRKVKSRPSVVGETSLPAAGLQAVAGVVAAYLATRPSPTIDELGSLVRGLRSAFAGSAPPPSS